MSREILADYNPHLQMPEQTRFSKYSRSKMQIPKKYNSLVGNNFINLIKYNSIRSIQIITVSYYGSL